MIEASRGDPFMPPTPTTSTTPGDADTSGQSSARGRGRGKSRGGLGKYLRAKGRRGGGRPAEFGKRLLLEDEAPPDEEDEEAAKELERKFTRRQLGSNVDRYKEEEPELDSDGEPIVEPEVDLSGFLERQRLSDDTKLAPIPGAKDAIADEDEDDDVDHSLAHLSSAFQGRPTVSKKGRVAQVDWDNSLAEMSKEKEAADAARDLKARFQVKAETLRARPAVPSKKESFVIPPPLPPSDGSQPPPKDSKRDMEAFLDELLD